MRSIRSRPTSAFPSETAEMEESTFSLPRLGTVNLHHGRLPDYRGGPPAFWEIYHQEPFMGVCVHQMDAELDHGALLGTAEVPIFDGDDAAAAMERAYAVDFALVGEVLRAIAAGATTPVPIDFASGKVRTLPSRGQLLGLQVRLGRPVRHDDFRRASVPPSA